MKKELDELGCDLLKVVLEALAQKLRESSEGKGEWTVVRKKVHKGTIPLCTALVY